MAKNEKKSTLRRAIVLIVLFCGAAIAVVLKTLSDKVLDGADANAKIEQNYRREEPVAAQRGDILAVDGRILACSVPNYRICMDPYAPSDELFNAEIDALSAKLSAFYKDMSTAEYKRKIVQARAKKRRFIIINNRRISYTEYKQVKEFPMFNQGQNKGGFIVEENDERKMPFGILASRTVGKLFKNNKDKLVGGVVGIENSYDRELRGVDGICNKSRLTGRWIREEIVAPADGYDVVTTIDVDIQDVAEHSLMKQLERYEADHGVAILMEVKTGAIRAIVNLHRTKDGKYSEDFYNYAIGELTEPGSTFKLATVMACLEDGLISVDDTINTFRGEYKIYDRVMRDSKRDGHGLISVKEAFEVSSNIAFSRIVMNCYGKDPQRFVKNLHNLGLCDTLGLDILGEKRTYIKNIDDATWSGTTLPWMSIGYEVKITPMQLLTFYNAVANNGTMMKPMFVTRLVDHGNTVRTMRPKVLRNSIASRKTIRTAQDLLKGVVEDGTAMNIKNTPYKIAGKTGTAQIAQGGGGYSLNGEKKYLASFAGYFPADEPLYSCIVMVSGPRNVYYGNTVAGSVVKDIADRVYAAEYRNGNVKKEPEIATSDVYPYSKGGRISDINTVLNELNIGHTHVVEKRDAWMSTAAKEDHIAVASRRFVENITPDIKGMGASDAVSLLESLGFRVQLSGYGRVTSQSIAPGTSFIKGTTIKIHLTNG